MTVGPPWDEDGEGAGLGLGLALGETLGCGEGLIAAATVAVNGFGPVAAAG
jgi:hypothetical protein